ncbi:MAG: type II toxin-antitoxin system death-on-curing family toxin [Lentisphaeria bacterium]|nr:type II toxin-antitoxin system death-on-curing family toxin [Lentisphaeria bacterium]
MNQEPLFLTLAEITEIHGYQIEFFGGSDGLRSQDMLESAAGMPSSSFGGNFLHPTIPDMAAAYLFHLVENHPFVDGNKRVGTMSALVFLELNETDFNATDDELTEVVLQVAGGKMSKDALSQFFRRHSLVL